VGGPERERYYLDTLKGPNGQAIRYERTGTVVSQSTILDIYQITSVGLSKPIVVYIDEYAFETLYAPMGLTCAGPFPISGPD
jgi:hypothetical protein